MPALATHRLNPSPLRRHFPLRFSANGIGALWFLALVTFSVLARAQPSTEPAPLANVVQLSARGFKEAPQDWLRMSLSTTRDGADAATVQNQLRQALDAALEVARQASQPQALEVRTGGFSLHPRYASNGKINGWQGSTELVLEGRDFARISSTAGRIQSLTVGSVGFSLSRQAQLALESEVQAMAIEQFKQRASEVSKAFGFSGYTLREIVISAADQGHIPIHTRLVSMQSAAPMMEGAVPVEAGKSIVNVTVSGSVQMR